MRLVKLNHPGYHVDSANGLLNDFFRSTLANDRFDKRELTQSPATNIYESDEAVVLELLVPGIAKENIKLSVESNTLIVRSEMQLETKDESQEQRYSHVEFEPKNFEKKFKLSAKLDQEKILAEVNNGILKITLAKKPEAVPVKREIEIG